jgi:hypothetical protein
MRILSRMTRLPSTTRLCGLSHSTIRPQGALPSVNDPVHFCGTFSQSRPRCYGTSRFCYAATSSNSTARPASKRPTADSYLHNNVNDLLSLRDNVIVITGAGRGIGLALAFAVVEAGGQVAVVDASPEPHKHFEILKQRGGRVGYYQ